MRIATRGSALALIQAGMVRDGLAAAGVPAELVIVETDGDRRAPDTAWGEGAFVAAIEHALVEERADVAVHSAKDVPIDGDPRLVIAAYLPREDPRDALVVRAGVMGVDPMSLPAGAVVGTDSPRRAGFLRALRADLVVRTIHGNVDTRLRRLDAGEADALVLAVAGLTRLGRADRITAALDPAIMPPAPGQGAIAVQVRRTDEAARAAVARLDDAPTRLVVEAERAFLDACGGGCRAPVGALATADGPGVQILGGLADGAGRAVTDSVGDIADVAGFAAGLVDRFAPGEAPMIGVTRAPAQATPLVRELAMRGLRGIRIPAIAIRPGDRGEVAGALAALPRGAWVLVTSPNGAWSIDHVPDGLRWAAVGPGTALALGSAGAHEVWTPTRPEARAFADELPVVAGDVCLLVRGDLADPDIPDRLEARGAAVRNVVAYRTAEGPEGSREPLMQALGRGMAAITFASGSAVRGVIRLAQASGSDVLDIPALCIGSATADVARTSGFRTVLTASNPSDEALAELALTTVAVPA
jgi:hydroxymethylbilane synthase